MRGTPKQSPRPSVKLSRGADGRLKQTSDASDIGDIWAEQRRIKLSQAIEEDKRKAAKEQKRAREILVTLQMPKLALPKFKWRSSFLHAVPKKWWLIGGAGVLFIVLNVTSFKLYDKGSGTDVAQHSSAAPQGVLGRQEGPGYHTLLPVGKTIEQLGGWNRVSPPDKDPAFAFADRIGGVRVTVSQQLLPENFKADLQGSIAKLAQDFHAEQTITAGATTVYVGTSTEGVQSLILTKDDLLILIRSEGIVADRQWADYLVDLQ